MKVLLYYIMKVKIYFLLYKNLIETLKIFLMIHKNFKIYSENFSKKKTILKRKKNFKAFPWCANFNSRRRKLAPENPRKTHREDLGKGQRPLWNHREVILT